MADTNKLEMKWLSYQEYRAMQEFMRQREIEAMFEMGLGWLLEFSYNVQKPNDGKRPE